MRLRTSHLMVVLAALPVSAMAQESCTADQLRDALIQRNQAQITQFDQQAAPARSGLAQLQAKIRDPKLPLASQLNQTELGQALAFRRTLNVTAVNEAVLNNQDEQLQVLTSLVAASEALKTATAAWVAKHGSLEGFSAQAALDAKSRNNLAILQDLMARYRQAYPASASGVRKILDTMTDKPTRDALSQVTGVGAD